MEQKLALSKRNFSLNKYDAEFFQYFVSNRDGGRGFSDDFGVPLNVQSITIDKFMNDRGLEYLDLLHSDIQGAEFGMLEGAEACLRQRRIGYFFISTHNDKHQKCLDRLLSHGYRILTQHDIETSSSADGLIVAASPTTAANPTDVEMLISSRRERR
jgi:hypothetical protein